MPDMIQDGTGAGVLGKVDASNRIWSRAIQETEAQHAGEQGDAYNINTGTISSIAAATALLYVANLEDRDLIVDAIAVGIGTGTITDIPKITVSGGPTSGAGGTLISSNNAVDMNQNRMIGSPKTLNVTALKGATGETVTGNTDIDLLYQTAGGRLYAPIDITVPKGSFIAIELDPDLSSGTISAYAELICHLKDASSVE